MRLHARLLAACLAALALSAAPAAAETSCAQGRISAAAPLESVAAAGEIDPDHHYGPDAMACRPRPQEHCRRLAFREAVTLRTALASCLDASTQRG